MHTLYINKWPCVCQVNQEEDNHPSSPTLLYRLSLYHPLLNVVLVEERLAILERRNHYGARWGHFQQSRQHPRIQSLDPARLIDALHGGQDTVARRIRPVRVDHLLAQLNLFVRLHDVKGSRQEGGNLFDKCK